MENHESGARADTAIGQQGGETTVEVFIAMNEAGDYEVDRTAREASETLANICGGSACRVVQLTVTMSRPAVETGPAVTIPDRAGQVVQAQAAE